MCSTCLESTTENFTLEFNKRITIAKQSSSTEAMKYNIDKIREDYNHEIKQIQLQLTVQNKSDSLYLFLY